MRKIVSTKFFNRPTLNMARDLLGKFLVRKIGPKTIVVMITEVEAYDGFKDKASHASCGKTKRNEPMFGLAGHWYVYLCYGTHWMLNIVTGPKDYPAAILIRGVSLLTSDRKLVNGPGKLTKFLKIDKQFNYKKASKKTGLWIAAPSTKKLSPLRRQFRRERFQIHKSSRIGVEYAGPVWSKKHYRFYLDVKKVRT